MQNTVFSAAGRGPAEILTIPGAGIFSVQAFA